LASLAPITDVSYDIYFNKIHGLTKDMKKVQEYKKLNIKSSGISKYQITQFNQILKFDWDRYMNILFPLTLARETKSRTVKILGFLNTGKVLLQDQNLLDWPIIAVPNEIIKILKTADTKGN
jgi:hypothetical protein